MKILPMRLNPGVLFFIPIILVCGISIKNDIDKYNILKEKDMRLRHVVERRRHNLNNLYVYRDQIKILTQDWDNRGKFFTTKEQMPLLLEEISKMGIKNSLLFESFTPSSEFGHDPYIKLPIAIALSGRYQQMVQFLIDLSHMPQLIAWNNFNIVNVASDASGELLHMDITVNIYKDLNQ